MHTTDDGLLLEQATHNPALMEAVKHFKPWLLRKRSKKKRGQSAPSAPVPRTMTESETARLRIRLGPAIVDHVESVALVESAASTATTSAQSAAPSPLRHDHDWTHDPHAGCYSCSKRGKVYVEGQAWRHHAAGTHLIVARGTGQDSLTAHLRSYDPGTVQAAAESTAEVHRLAAQILQGTRSAGLLLTESQRAHIGRVLNPDVLPASARDAITQILTRAGAR